MLTVKRRTTEYKYSSRYESRHCAELTSLMGLSTREDEAACSNPACTLLEYIGYLQGEEYIRCGSPSVSKDTVSLKHCSLHSSGEEAIA